MFLAAALGLSNASAARKAEPVPLTAAGEKLLAHYTAMLTALRAETVKSVPGIDEKKRDAFLKAYAAEAAAKSARDAAMGAAQRAKKEEKEAAAKALQDAETAFAQSKTNTLSAAKAILSEVTQFLADDKVDARLVKCAVIANATPRGLAEFAQQGEKEAALIEKILADDDLMKQMLEAGGARTGKYGKAMQIYTDIQKASKRAREGGILQRVALGTSLEQAVPVKHFDMDTFVDPVKRYLHYEEAYLNGELDPEFKNMTTWEYRLITNCDAPDETLAWGREMMRNHRPDLIADPEYRWRYVRIAKTDVARKAPEWVATPRTYQQLVAGGGKCGPIAWFARFATRCFGIPTWGVRQRGHAAMSHWTPDGWTVCFGAHWRWNWWDRPGHRRRGLDFLLETQAREYPKDYLKVLRAQWIGDALGEDKVDGMRIGTGGFWNALALYQKKAIVAEAKPVEVERTKSWTGEPVVKVEITEGDRKIDIGKDGVISIPAVACIKPTTNTTKILFMKSSSDGMQLYHRRLGGKTPEDSVFEYTFDAPQAGKYALTARVVTVHRDVQLSLTPNAAKAPINIDIPNTVGMWADTKPVEIALVKGKNTLSFTRQTVNNSLTIKQFTLTPLK